MRTLMLANGASVYGVGLDYLVLILATTVLIYIASRVYPNVVV